MFLLFLFVLAIFCVFVFLSCVHVLSFVYPLYICLPYNLLTNLTCSRISCAIDTRLRNLFMKETRSPALLTSFPHNQFHHMRDAPRDGCVHEESPALFIPFPHGQIHHVAASKLAFPKRQTTQKKQNTQKHKLNHEGSPKPGLTHSIPS